MKPAATELASAVPTELTVSGLEQDQDFLRKVEFLQQEKILYNYADLEGYAYEKLQKCITNREVILGEVHEEVLKGARKMEKDMEEMKPVFSQAHQRIVTLTTEATELKALLEGTRKENASLQGQVEFLQQQVDTARRKAASDQDEIRRISGARLHLLQQRDHLSEVIEAQRQVMDMLASGDEISLDFFEQAASNEVLTHSIKVAMGVQQEIKACVNDELSWKSMSIMNLHTSVLGGSSSDDTVDPKNMSEETEPAKNPDKSADTAQQSGSSESDKTQFDSQGSTETSPPACKEVLNMSKDEGKFLVRPGTVTKARKAFTQWASNKAKEEIQARPSTPGGKAAWATSASAKPASSTTAR